MARLPRSPIAEIMPSGEAPGVVEPMELNTRTPLAQASFAGKAAVLLNARLQRMQQERDVLDAINARNEYRDSLRNLKTETFANNQGKYANQTLYSQHQAESVKIKTDIARKLTQGAQMRFIQLAQSDQDSHLDQILNYIVRETEQYKVDTLKNSIISGIDKVRNDVNSYPHERDSIFAMIDRLNPDQDNQVAKMQINNQLQSAQIESMIDSDPAIARDYLDKHKKEIGEEIYSKYSNFVNKQTETRINEIKRDALNNEAAAKDDAVNQVYGFMRNGQYVNALKFINNNSQLDQEEKFKLEQALDYKMQTGKDPFSESNPAYVSALLKKAANGEFTEDEVLRIIPIAGRLSRQDANMVKGIAMDVLKGSDNGYTKTLQMAMKSVEQQITRDNQLIKVVPEVVEWNFVAQHELLNALNNEKDQVKRLDMLNPKSEHYIIPKILAPYIGKSLDEQIQMKMKKYNEAIGAEPQEEKPPFFSFERWLGKKKEIDKKAQLNQNDEKKFQDWYANWSQKLGLNPNPDDPEHFYDYRAAYKAGLGPDQTGHWPSQFKLEGHSNMIVNGVNTKTGLKIANPKRNPGETIDAWKKRTGQ